MDLLTSSGSLVTTAAAGKAVGTWAARRPFGGVDNGRFAASMGTVLGRGGRIRRSHRHYCARMGVVGEGLQRFGSGASGGGRKSVHNVGVDRDCGLTLTFLCGLFNALFLGEKYEGGMMLVCY
jgi:hypothetical protein